MGPEAGSRGIWGTCFCLFGGFFCSGFFFVVVLIAVVWFLFCLFVFQP